MVCSPLGTHYEHELALIISHSKGRFFVEMTSKLILAYIIMNYEVEQRPQRPGCRWLGSLVLTPSDASIRVRRKKMGV
jgi:hypothetical protein